MDVFEAIKLRRSAREYQDKPMPKELLEKLVDAARFAPTARAIQPWEFVVITEPTALKKIGEISDHGKFISQAKACIAVYCKETKYYLEDGCAATENILIAATSLGLASCWVAGDKKPYCSQIAGLLNVPSSFKLVSLIALGYPASAAAFRIATDKRTVKEVTHWERF